MGEPFFYYGDYEHESDSEYDTRQWSSQRMSAEEERDLAMATRDSESYYGMFEQNRKLTNDSPLDRLEHAFRNSEVRDRFEHGTHDFSDRNREVEGDTNRRQNYALPGTTPRDDATSRQDKETLKLVQRSIDERRKMNQEQNVRTKQNSVPSEDNGMGDEVRNAPRSAAYAAASARMEKTARALHSKDVGRKQMLREVKQHPGQKSVNDKVNIGGAAAGQEEIRLRAQSAALARQESSRIREELAEIERDLEKQVSSKPHSDYGWKKWRDEHPHKK